MEHLFVGRSVEATIRALFLLELKIEHPERSYAVHRFLAQIYKQWARDEPGADRVRYLGSYLYHSASAVEMGTLEHVLPALVDEIVEMPLSLLSHWWMKSHGTRISMSSWVNISLRYDRY